MRQPHRGPPLPRGHHRRRRRQPAGADDIAHFRRDRDRQNHHPPLALVNIARRAWATRAGRRELTRKPPPCRVDHRDVVVGIKTAHYWTSLPFDAEHPPWASVERAVDAGSVCDMPVMVDFWPRPGAPLPRPDPGARPGRHPHPRLRPAVPRHRRRGRGGPYMREARARGVWFDLGHGAASFWFRNAKRALDDGFPPDSISTDLHDGSVRATVHSMLDAMSKCLADQLSDALAAAHAQGIIHRDLKPGNIVLTADERAKVLDFGIARVLPADPSAHATAQTTPAMFVGTVGYAAPEQCLGQPVDARADIFSLAVVLFEMLSGQRPFAGDDVTTVMRAMLQADPPHVSDSVPTLTPALDSLIMRALSRSPAQRPGTVREFREGLRAIVTDQRLAALPPAPISASASRPRWLIAAVLAVALGTGGARVVDCRESNTRPAEGQAANRGRDATGQCERRRKQGLPRTRRGRKPDYAPRGPPVDHRAVAFGGGGREGADARAANAGCGARCHVPRRWQRAAIRRADPDQSEPRAAGRLRRLGRHRRGTVRRHPCAADAPGIGARASRRGAALRRRSRDARPAGHDQRRGPVVLLARQGAAGAPGHQGQSRSGAGLL